MELERHVTKCPELTARLRLIASRPPNSEAIESFAGGIGDSGIRRPTGEGVALADVVEYKEGVAHGSGHIGERALRTREVSGCDSRHAECDRQRDHDAEG